MQFFKILVFFIRFSMDDFSGFSNQNIEDVVLTPLTHFIMIVIPDETFISRLNCKSKTKIPTSRETKFKIKRDKTRFNVCNVE